MKDEKNLIDKKDEKKVSGGSMKCGHVSISVSGPYTAKDGTKNSVTGTFDAPITAPYCDACGKDITDEKFKVFMNGDSIYHICENCINAGHSNIFSKK